MPQEKTHQNIYDTLAADLIHTSAGARPATIHQWLEKHMDKVLVDMVNAAEPNCDYWSATVEVRRNFNDFYVRFWHSEAKEFTTGRNLSQVIQEANRRWDFVVTQLPAIEPPRPEDELPF